MIAERLDELVNSWLDDSLTDIDQAELETSLLAEVGLREQFWTLASLHGALAEMMQFRSAVQPHSPRNGTGEQSPPPPPRLISLLPQLLRDWLSANPFGSPRMLATCVAMGMGVYFASLLLSLAWQRNWQVQNDLRPSSRIASGTTQRGSAIVARLLHVEKCQWDGISAPLSGDALKAGRLQLTSGVAEIEFVDGATVRITGPTDFDLLSPALGFLREGKLWVRVPQRARNFAIETPTARVVDLGTAFVVEVSHDAATRLAVIEGIVEVLSADGRQTFADSNRKQFLTVGQAMTVAHDPSGVIVATAAPFDAAWVQRTASAGANMTDTALPPATDRESRGAYSRAVLATPGLAAYWRLDDVGPPTVADEVGRDASDPMVRSGRQPGIYRNFGGPDFSQPGAVADSGNAAVRFNGINSLIEVRDDAMLNRSWAGLTIAAWLWPERSVKHSMIVGRWPQSVREDHFGLFVNDLFPLIVVADGVTPADDGLRATQPLEPGCWNFVVATWSAETKLYRIYCDGEPDAATGAHNGTINGHSTAPLLIGGQELGAPGYFAGLIDEVAIFNRALRPGEVAQLYRSRSVSGRTTK